MICRKAGILFIVSVLLIVFLLPFSVFAATGLSSTDYYIDDGRMKVTIMDGQYEYVITRNKIYHLGLPSVLDSQTKAYLLQNDLYLDAYTKDLSYEFTVVIKPISSITDLRQLSNSELKEFIPEYDNTLEQAGGNNIKTTIGMSDADSPKYLETVFDYPQDGKYYKRTSYYTIYNGRAVTLNFTDYSGTGNTHGLSETAQKYMIEFTAESKYQPLSAADEKDIADNTKTNSGKSTVIVFCVVIIVVVIVIIIVHFVRRSVKSANMGNSAHKESAEEEENESERELIDESQTAEKNVENNQTHTPDFGTVNNTEENKITELSGIAEEKRIQLLREYAELKNQGILTEEEFDRKKKEILQM